MIDLETPRRTASTERLQRLVLGLSALVLALLAAGMLGGAFLYFTKTHPFLRTYSLSVVFPNARGVEAGAPIQMAGVRIGTVEQVALHDQQADIILNIQQGTRIARHSRFVACPLLFSAPAGITVVPPSVSAASTAEFLAPEEANLVGEASPDIAEVVERATPLLSEIKQVGQKTSALLDETTHCVQNINSVVGDHRTQRELKYTISSLHLAAAGGARLMPEFSLTARRTRSAPRLC